MTNEQQIAVIQTMRFVRCHPNAGSYTNAEVIEWIDKHYKEIK